MSTTFGIFKKQMLIILVWQSVQSIYNFIPNEIITCDGWDPPWIENSIRCLIQDKNETCKRFQSSTKNNQHLKFFQSLHSLLGVEACIPPIFHGNKSVTDVKKQKNKKTLIWVGGWRYGVILLPCWFSSNNSETVKAVTLTYCKAVTLA